MKLWTTLCDFINKWHQSPDMEAINTMLAVYTAHYYISEPPIWLFLVGPPGTGRTAIAMGLLGSLSRVSMVDDLTPQTFLSGLTKGSDPKRYSLLHRIGADGIIAMSDFGTFQSKRHEVVSEVAGQMRRVYDGRFDRDVGSSKVALSWEGKITIIAAMTQGGEQRWQSFRSLGERFMQIRWPRGPGVATVEAAQHQVGNEAEISRKMKQICAAFVNCDNFPTINKPIIDQRLSNLAELTARLRATAPKKGEYEEAEQGTRIGKALAQVIRGNATLFRREVDPVVDFKIAQRLALDSIPLNRSKVMRELSRGSATLHDLREWTRMPLPVIKKAAEDLVQLGAVAKEKKAKEEGSGSVYMMEAEFEELMQKAGVFGE